VTSPDALPGGSVVPAARMETAQEPQADRLAASVPPLPWRDRLRVAIAWGLLWAVIGALALNYLAPKPWSIQPIRATELRASLAVLDHGGPALLGYRPGTHVAYAIGYSDDQGIYVIVPVLSHWLGASDPVAVLRWLWVAAWALALLFSAVVFGSLFRSSWAALLAPPTLLVCIFSFGFGDIYWVAAWVVVALMPLLILLARRRPRGMWAAIAAIAFVAGCVTAVRSDAGLGVGLAAVVVAAMAGGRWRRRAAVIAAVGAAYLAPTWIVMPLIRDHRDHYVGTNLSAQAPTSHPLWHSLYIGLGYTSNRYGIHYRDGYAAAAAQEADPGVAYLSPAYSRALHKQVDALIEHDPSFVVRAEAQKGVVELSHAGRYVLLLALLLPAAIAARGPARLRPRELALFIPAVLIGALPAIVAIPIRDYELGLLAPLAALGLLAIGSVAASAEGVWTATRGADSGLAGHARLMLQGLWDAWPKRATYRALAPAVVILALAFVFARHVEAEHESWDRSERNPPKVVLAAVSAGLPPVA